MTITGTHFLDGVVQVAFGSVIAPSFAVTSDTTLDVTVPLNAPGLVNVIVTNAAGTSATSSADQYTYSADVSLGTVTVLSPGGSWPTT